ncbi:MAG: HPF/RaiA family ribosome-associated protein [Acidobacteria bacterium]|nr:HPF/RaiA family ribosome-associated protein [Acidobacteriota bacterium]
MRYNPNSHQRRSAFPPAGTRPRSETLGRTTTEQTPLWVRTFGLAGIPDARTYVRRHAGFKLGKFAYHIEGLQVRMKNESGPKGAPLAVCTITVDLARAGIVVVEQASQSPMAAFDLALDSAERSVRRTLQKIGDRKRQPKPE